MDSIRLNVFRSTITACFWFRASVIYFRGIADIAVSLQCLCDGVIKKLLMVESGDAVGKECPDYY